MSGGTQGEGENAIAGFSFAGLMFPGGELPVRLICRPYLFRWKIACLGLPVNNCQTFKFPVVLLPVTDIYRRWITAECNCRWYIYQCKAMDFLEPNNWILGSRQQLPFKHWTLHLASRIPQGPQVQILGPDIWRINHTQDQTYKGLYKLILEALGVWNQPGTHETGPHWQSLT